MDRQLVLLIRQCAIPETKKKNKVNCLTLEEQVHVLRKFWGFHDHPIPDVP